MIICAKINWYCKLNLMWLLWKQPNIINYHADWDWTVFECLLRRHRKLTKLIAWMTAFSKLKLWAMLSSAAQDGRVMVESTNKMWSAGEGNDKAIQDSFLENPMDSKKRQKDRTMKDELPRSVGAQTCYWRSVEK